MAKLNRREMIQTGALLGGSVAAGGWTEVPPAAYSRDVHCRWQQEYTFGHSVLFMEEYYQGTLDILGAQSGELEQIGDLTSRAASLVRQGGTVWTSMNLGHMPYYEQKDDRRGSPGIMKTHATSLGAEEDFDQMRPGDIVFTNRANKTVLAARERGVYVVCVTTNYWDNEFRPRGYNHMSHGNPDGLMLKDVSNEILHSHTPYEQGLVHAPEIPEFTICPSSATGSGSIHWMLNAEIANKLAHPNAKVVEKSAQYLRVLTDRVQRIRRHFDLIQEAAAIMAERVRAGGRWFGRSIEHPGFESEFHVASGVRMVNWGNWDANREKNVMFINAISPAYREEVRLALEKQVEGAYVVGVGPASIDGVVPHGRIIDVADAGFDNFSPESRGVIEIVGQSQTICPTSGIVGNVIQQMIIAQWVDEMVRRGAVPYFLMGVYREGGREYNAGMKPFFEKQGY